jgi:hypothetical protein
MANRYTRGMKLWQILVPCFRPDGRKFGIKHHKTWDVKVREIAKGLTVLQPVKGHWVKPDGTVLAERMIPCLIACSDEQMEQIVALTGPYYQQEAVMWWAVSEQAYITHFKQV